jgi:hypothetical protein
MKEDGQLGHPRGLLIYSRPMNNVKRDRDLVSIYLSSHCYPSSDRVSSGIRNTGSRQLRSGTSE